MAIPTKLFMTATVAPYAPPVPTNVDFKGQWNSGYSNAVALETTASGTAAEYKRTTTTTVDSDQVLRRGVLNALTGGGLLGGTVKIQMRCRETNASANAFLHAHLCVLAGATPTVRGTLLRDHIGSGEFAVSTSVRSILSSEELQLAAVDALSGDLILAELGFRASSSLSTYEAAEEFAGLDVWLEFSGLDGLNVVDLNTSTSRSPRFRGAVTYNHPDANSDATSKWFPVPEGAAIRDIMVAEVFIEPVGATVGVPPGFVEAPNSPVTVASTYDHRVFWKRLTQADTGLYTFTFPSGGALGAVIARFDKCISYGTPFEALTSTAKAAQTTAGTTSPAVSGTTTGPSRLWVFQAMDYATVKWSGYTSTFLEAEDDTLGQAMAVKDQAVAGASGSITATASASNKMTAWLGALIGEPTRPGQFFHTLG